MMENLFDSLCSCLMLSSNRDRFLKGEGLQLMNLMLRYQRALLPALPPHLAQLLRAALAGCPLPLLSLPVSWTFSATEPHPASS